MHDHSRFQRDINDVTGVSLSLSLSLSQKSLTHNIGSASALPIIYIYEVPRKGPVPYSGPQRDFFAPFLDRLFYHTVVHYNGPVPYSGPRSYNGPRIMK